MENEIDRQKMIQIDKNEIDRWKMRQIDRK